MATENAGRSDDGGNAGGEGAGVRVECTECFFERVVREHHDERPADVIIEHGRETGHTLEIHR
jgi:hypothetical protein